MQTAEIIKETTKFIRNNGSEITDKLIDEIKLRVADEEFIRMKTDDFIIGKSISFKFKSKGVVYLTLNKYKNGKLTGSYFLSSYGTKRLRDYKEFLENPIFLKKETVVKPLTKEEEEKKAYLQDIYNEFGVEHAMAMMGVV